MTSAMVAPARFSDASYPELLESARSLLTRSTETILAAGELFGQMLALETLERIADDTDLTPGTVLRYSRVALFWNGVRIGPDQNGRPATYPLYDRVALDPLMTDAEKQEIRRHARRGRHIVVEMVKAFRAVHVAAPRHRAAVAEQALNGLVHAEQRLVRLQPGDVDGRTVDELHALVQTLVGHVDLLRAASVGE
jgi:hypothetical protein